MSTALGRQANLARARPPSLPQSPSPPKLLPLTQEVLFEEIGVDSDKMVGADFEGAKALLQPIKKMRR